MNPLPLGNVVLEFIALQAEWSVLAIARPFGFTLLFYAFAWGKIDSGLIRMGFAMAIALPSMASVPTAFSVHDLEWPYVALLVKEIFIGGVIGLFASMPLAIALSAGSVIDIYVGSSQGSPDPAGGDAPPVAKILAVISLWVFASVGGFWIIVQLIYSSYTIWPAVDPLPRMMLSGGDLLRFGGNIILGALVLAGPVLAILFFSDLIHLISTKFGKQINVSHLSFSSKNLLLVIILPVFLVYAFQAMKSGYADLGTVLEPIQRLFP